MKVLSFFLIILFLVPDLVLGFQVFGLDVSMKICGLFLCYQVMRQEIVYVSMLLLFFSILTAPFSGTGLLSIYVSYFLTFFIYSRLREEIYTETYVVQALWVFVMMSVQDLLNVLFSNPVLSGYSLSSILMEIILNNLISSFFVVPFFIVLDHLFNFVSGNPFDEKWTRKSFILDKGSSDDLI